MHNKQKGYTLVELIIVVFLLCMVVVVGGGVFGLSRANCWYRESGVLRELRIMHPEAREVLKSERNFVSYSEITVRNEDGTIVVYALDSNIMFNYNFIK